MSERAGWGILGSGGIATIFAAAIRASASGRIATVTSRDRLRGAAFAAEVGADRASPSYPALLDDTDVEIVYVATPHPTHAALAIAALEAGKHVLCEKPIAVTTSDAERMVTVARREGRFLVEGFAFRHHPQTRRLIELLSDGAIGEVRAIDAPFGYDAGPTPTNYLFRRDSPAAASSMWAAIPSPWCACSPAWLPPGRSAIRTSLWGRVRSTPRPASTSMRPPSRGSRADRQPS